MQNWYNVLRLTKLQKLRKSAKPIRKKVIAIARHI